jgi:hypothetical protein
MALRKDLDDLDTNGQKGDWCFVNNDTYIVLRIGEDPFRDSCVLPIAEVDGKKPWSWDGNREAPTLSPSILHRGNGRQQPATWHGYLRAGELIDA